MRDFAETVDDLDLVNRMNARAETAMHTEDLIVDDTAQREVVEHIREVVPHCRVAVFS
jgi:uncharacterized protein (DUF305 family)